MSDLTWFRRKNRTTTLLSDLTLRTDIEAACVCGHKLAVHVIAHTDHPKENCSVCDCQNFWAAP